MISLASMRPCHMRHVALRPMTESGGLKRKGHELTYVCVLVRMHSCVLAFLCMCLQVFPCAVVCKRVQPRYRLKGGEWWAGQWDPAVGVLRGDRVAQGKVPGFFSPDLVVSFLAEP